jgi:hypothetical protein
MNPSRSRSKRVPPRRGGPVRNLMAPLRDKTDGEKKNGEKKNGMPGGTWPASGTVVDEALRAASKTAAISNEALRGALECSVQTAYAVIDDYMKRGYAAARDLNPSGRDNPNNRGYMGEDKTSYSSWSNPWGPMSPLMEQWSVAMRAWTDAWTALIPGARPGMWPPPMWNMGGMASASSTGPTPGVSVEVSSKRPVEVTANLKPGTDLMGKLTADSFVPPLQKAAVAIKYQGGHPRVSVTVADEQPAGRYNGVIRGTDGSIAGDVTVVIAERTAEPA